MRLAVNEAVVEVIRTLENAGYEAYVVGGAVRDLLLSRPVPDWDVATNATPDEVMRLFQESFYDNAYGTVMVTGKHLCEQFEMPEGVIHQESVVDITTYRSEEGYSDRRRPDNVVWGKTIEEDLKRRDFTINAIALKILETSGVKHEVELVDGYGGREDIEKKLIRAVGDPRRRFEEDALRMMRAVRIASQLGFEIEKETEEAIQKNAKLIEEISWERIGAETMKILASDNPAEGVEKMREVGLLKYVIPELLEGVGLAQKGRHKYDVYRHSIESLRNCPSPDPVVRLATLVHDVAKPIVVKNAGQREKVTFHNHEVVGARVAKKISERLRLSKKDQDLIFTLVRWHMFSYDKMMTDAAIRRFIKNVGRENIHKMMMLRVGDRLGGGSKATSWRLTELQKRIGEQLYQPMSLKDLQIDGSSVMRILKVGPGPKVGKILNVLFDEVMEDTSKNTKEYLEKRIKEMGEVKD